MNEKKVIKKWQFVLFAVIAISFLVLKVYDWFYWPKGDVLFGDKSIKVLIADRPSHQYKGWSDRNSMGSVEGMWFDFNSRAYYIMVMRDMKFPLDIIWIDDGKIIDIAPSLQPEPEREESQLTQYRPRLPATDVLEVKAGFIAENSLKIGDTVELIRY